MEKSGFSNFTQYPTHLAFRAPHIKLNANGQITGFRWAPHSEGPIQVPEEDIIPYYEAYACLAKAIEETEFQFRLKLQEGDLLTMNNHRWLHGREALRLNGGVRRLINMYVNIDEFKSKFQVLCSRYDPDYHVKHVLNGEHIF